jgi:homoserine kinase
VTIDPGNVVGYRPDRKPGVRVTVPASAANLGPGFDVLALALDLRNTYDVWEIGDSLRVEVVGEGKATIPTDDTNLFHYAMQSFYALAGYQPQGLLIREHNMIPLARGLGSSAATIVGALLAARFVSGFQMDDDRLLDLAASLEGHGDNVAAAYRGGFNLAIPETGGRHTVRRLIWPRQLGCALFVPELLVSTESAREVLPESYNRDHVVHNLARLALFISALNEGRMEDLRIATEDKLHQPYRAELVPGLDRIIDAAVAAGAFGAFLSGAGPSILALHDNQASGRGEKIARAMVRAAQEFGLEGKPLALDVSLQGAAFQSLPEDPSGVAFSR